MSQPSKSEIWMCHCVTESMKFEVLMCQYDQKNGG